MNYLHLQRVSMTQEQIDKQWAALETAAPTLYPQAGPDALWDSVYFAFRSWLAGSGGVEFDADEDNADAYTGWRVFRHPVREDRALKVLFPPQ